MNKRRPLIRQYAVFAALAAGTLTINELPSIDILLSAGKGEGKRNPRRTGHKHMAHKRASVKAAAKRRGLK